MSRPGFLLPSIVILMLSSCARPVNHSEVDISEKTKNTAATQRFEQMTAEPQIEGGGEISLATFPRFRFVATLGVELSPSSFRGQCGGTLIDEDWVLTAAHCARNNYLLLGQRDLLGSGGESHEIVDADRFCHKPRNLTTSENDIALIRLSRGANGIAPVSRVTNNLWEESSPPVTLTGWGNGSNSTRVHQIEVRLHDRDQCQQSFLLLHSPIRVPGNAFCTISSEGGALERDSGGPVLIDQSGRPVLVGIMTAVGGEISGVQGRPNRHLRVTDYRDWIDRVMDETAEPEEFDHCS